MNMKKSFLLAALLLAAWGCQKAEQTVPAEVAVRIGDETITEQDVNERLVLLSKDDREFAQTPIGRQNLLQIIAREKLIQTAAK